MMFDRIIAWHWLAIYSVLSLYVLFVDMLLFSFFLMAVI